LSPLQEVDNSSITTTPTTTPPGTAATTPITSSNGAAITPTTTTNDDALLELLADDPAANYFATHGSLLTAYLPPDPPHSRPSHSHKNSNPPYSEPYQKTLAAAASAAHAAVNLCAHSLLELAHDKIRSTTQQKPTSTTTKKQPPLGHHHYQPLLSQVGAAKQVQEALECKALKCASALPQQHGLSTKEAHAKSKKISHCPPMAALPLTG
jgi:hypothetical protein